LRKDVRNRLGKGVSLGKGARNCSVENPDSHNHYIMRKSLQDDLSALHPVAAGPQGRAEQAIDHRFDGLDLPPLPVLAYVKSKSLFHHSPPMSCGRLVRRPHSHRWNDRACASGSYSEMDPLGVEVGVSQQCADPRSEDCLTERRPEPHQTGIWTAARHRRQDHPRCQIPPSGQIR
jgi:hypothetical protein